MRNFLIAALCAGLLSTVLGAIGCIGLQGELSTRPAIVTVPQLILWELLGALGFLTSTVAAAGLLIAERLEDQRRALDRIARQTDPTPPKPSIRPG